MFPSQSVAMRFSTIDEVKDHYQLRPEIWNSFVTVAGDPGQDLRLLASLPTNVVGAALAGARLNGTTPLSAVQASHVGLVWSLAKRIMHTRSGGDWDSWVHVTPFQESNNVTKAQQEAIPHLHLLHPQLWKGR